MKPLMPSPGSPNTVSTPQSINRSSKRSETVCAITLPYSPTPGAEVDAARDAPSVIPRRPRAQSVVPTSNGSTAASECQSCRPARRSASPSSGFLPGLAKRADRIAGVTVRPRLYLMQPVYHHPRLVAAAEVGESGRLQTSGDHGELYPSNMQGGPVGELLDVAVERSTLDQLEVEVGRTLEDRIRSVLAGDHREEGHLQAVDQAGGHQRPIHRQAPMRAQRHLGLLLEPGH